jgi:hypothetical protein
MYILLIIFTKNEQISSDYKTERRLKTNKSGMQRQENLNSLSGKFVKMRKLQTKISFKLM